MIKFSIVTPTFNQLDWLNLCISSVRDQVIQDSQKFCVEHIIQDAGTPGIEELAAALGAHFFKDTWREDGAENNGMNHKRLDYCTNCASSYTIKIFSEKDSGMYDALNRGFARSSGSICAWLNSDEQYLPETLFKVSEIFQRRKNLDVLLGDAILLNSSLDPICYRRVMIPNLWHTRLDHLHSLSCSMFIRRSALPSPALDTRWKVISDAVLMEHFLKTRKKIYACRKPLAAYFFTGQNLSADKSCDELDRWWAETRWPPKVIRPILIWHNRLRRLFAGAYRSFELDTQIHTPQRRKQLDGRVQGFWPKQLGS